MAQAEEAVALSLQIGIVKETRDRAPSGRRVGCDTTHMAASHGIYATG